ncbi:hypothetical protein EDB80DRAFT_682911 [Ilyonectria destructans]|nr:hypothetical protein EDB80DRAFT_682911 [Ilyonectria destructans]
MARKAYIACITPKTPELRDTFLKHLRRAAEVAYNDEAKTLRYSIALPLDTNTSDQLSIYAIEEYTDDSGFDAHVKQEAFVEIMRLMRDGTLAKEPLTLSLEVDEDFGFTRPELAQVSDLFVAVTELHYKPGKGSEALRHLRAAGISKQESGTLSVSLYADPKDADTLRLVGVYESQDYWANIHSKSPQALEFQAATQDMLADVKAHVLNPIGGYLYKAETQNAG